MGHSRRAAAAKVRAEEGGEWEGNQKRRRTGVCVLALLDQGDGVVAIVISGVLLELLLLAARLLFGQNGRKAEFAKEGIYFANRFPSLRTFARKKVEI